MGDNIQLKNPQEVLAYIAREAELLNQYAELVSQEARELSALESLVSETIQIVNTRKRGLYVAIEQTRRQEDSDAKRQALIGFQKKLEQYENQSRSVNQCKEDLISIRQDYMSLTKESTTISDTGKKLSNKIQMLINKIVETL